MFRKLAHADNTDPEVLKLRKLHFHADDNGNSLPFGWAEITDRELVKSTPWGTYEPTHQEFRQARLVGNNGRECFTGMFLYFFHDDTGVAMVTDYWNAPHVRWFRFGCKHQYREMTPAECSAQSITLFRCIHAYVCEKCGHVNVVDSSD